MATLVTFHAHPDDEAIATGGTMALAAADGHRVVLVTATRGEHGEPVPGVLGDGEALWERRVVETHAAGKVLGVERVEFLGYRDSGMMGEPTNDDPTCFWQADIEDAAAKLAAILTEVDATVLTVYDDHGGYGHPDHIQVHRVGVRAAELAGVTAVFQSTMNRDAIREAMIEARTEMMADLTPEEIERFDTAEAEEFGSPEALITHGVDVRSVIGTKREAMLAHRSQISDDSFFLTMPPEIFERSFGTEWYIRLGATRPAGAAMGTDLFDGVLSE